MRPYLTIAFVLRFIFAYKVFDPIFIMTAGGPGSSTQVLSMRVYERAFQHFAIGEGSALAILILIGGIAIAQVFIRRFLLARTEEGTTA
jgi:multiple sugar transport system permease protein